MDIAGNTSVRHHVHYNFMTVKQHNCRQILTTR